MTVLNTEPGVKVTKTILVKTIKGKAKKNYSNFIYKLLKQGKHDNGISKIKDDIAIAIADEAARLALYNKRKIITNNEIQTAIKNILTPAPSVTPTEPRPEQSGTSKD